MRLLEVFQKPDYQPLDRGESFHMVKQKKALIVSSTGTKQ
jgi:hypothetical protein